MARKKKLIEHPACSQCGRPVVLNGRGELPCHGKHPYFHECGRVLCSGRWCDR